MATIVVNIHQRLKSRLLATYQTHAPDNHIIILENKKNSVNLSMLYVLQRLSKQPSLNDIFHSKDIQRGALISWNPTTEMSHHSGSLNITRRRQAPILCYRTTHP